MTEIITNKNNYYNKIITNFHKIITKWTENNKSKERYKINTNEHKIMRN